MDINESPVYVLLNPAINHAQKDLPVTIYESGILFFSPIIIIDCLIFLKILIFLSSKLEEFHVIDGIPQPIFVHTSYTIEVCVYAT